MITNPSAAQVALEIRRELQELAESEPVSAQAKVAIEMIENCLRNLAVRSEHEIAWMRDESDSIERFASDMLETIDDSAVRAALAEYRDARSDSLHASDVRADYDRASEVLSCVAEAVVASGSADLRARLVAILGDRQAREAEIMGDFAFVGRG